MQSNLFANASMIAWATASCRPLLQKSDNVESSSPMTKPQSMSRTEVRLLRSHNTELEEGFRVPTIGSSTMRRGTSCACVVATSSSVPHLLSSLRHANMLHAASDAVSFHKRGPHDASLEVSLLVAPALSFASRTSKVPRRRAYPRRQGGWTRMRAAGRIFDYVWGGSSMLARPKI